MEIYFRTIFYLIKNSVKSIKLCGVFSALVFEKYFEKI